MTDSSAHQAIADAPKKSTEAAVKASVHEHFGDEIQQMGQPVCALSGNDHWMVPVQYKDGSYAILLGSPGHSNWNDIGLNELIAESIKSATAMPKIAFDCKGKGTVILPVNKLELHLPL